MRRIPVALGVSLLLHALLLLLLWRAVPPEAPRPPPPREPLVFEVVERPAPPPVAAPAPAPPARREAGKVTAPKPPRVGAASPASRAPAPLASDVPTAPPALDLSPRLSWTPPEGSLPAPRGRTLRPGDPSLSPEVQRAEEQARVQGRLESFGDEAFAAARARGGASHPYLVQVRDALRQGLKSAGPATAEGLGFEKGMQPLLQQYARNYQATLEQYGSTGSTGLTHTHAPTHAEKVAEVIPKADWLRFYMRLQETRDAMLDRAPLLGLDLELTQGRDGTLVSAAIVESSGNRLFDALVLKIAPAALGAAGVPPAEAFRREHLRSRWRVEGRLQLTAQSRAALSGMVSSVVGVPADAVRKHLEEQSPKLTYDARLLRYY